MSDDLVARLRAGGETCGADTCKVKDASSGCLCALAADRIEQLEAALREIAASAWDCNGKTCEHCQPNSCQNAFIARKALEGKDD